MNPDSQQAEGVTAALPYQLRLTTGNNHSALPARLTLAALASASSCWYSSSSRSCSTSRCSCWISSGAPRGPAFTCAPLAVTTLTTAVAAAPSGGEADRRPGDTDEREGSPGFPGSGGTPRPNEMRELPAGVDDIGLLFSGPAPPLARAAAARAPVRSADCARLGGYCWGCGGSPEAAAAAAACLSARSMACSELRPSGDPGALICASCCSDGQVLATPDSATALLRPPPGSCARLLRVAP